MSQSVSEVVWPWRAPAVTPLEGGRRRRRAVLQAALAAIVGALVYGWMDRHVLGIVVWSMAAVMLVSGLFLPAVFLALERFGQRLGRWTGTVLTWGLLVPFFYLCFVPGRLLLALCGKDPLQRRFPTDEPTYWTPRPPVRDVSQYRKQF